MLSLPVLTITWHTHPDEINVCPFCRRLNGRQWTFFRRDVKKARLPSVLVYPGLGVVWNFNTNLPRTHGTGTRGHWNCRCQLSYAFNFNEIGDGEMIPSIAERVSQIASRVNIIAEQVGV